MGSIVAVASAVVVLVLLAVRLPGAEPFSVVGLPATDIVIITYRSQGCFHAAESTLVLRGEVLVGYDGSPDLAGNPPSIASIPWTAEDAQALDRLFLFYEGVGEGACTTVDDIAIRHLRDGKPIAIRSYRDGTCAVHGVEGALTMNELLRRLRAAAAAP